MNLDWVLENWQWILLIVLALVEALVRYLPTEVDRSILNTIAQILDAILPKNKVKHGGKFVLSNLRK